MYLQNRNVSRRRTVATATAVLAATGLVACSSPSGSDDSSGAPGSIRVADYYTDEPANTIIGDALEECGDTAGVTIEHESVPSGDYLAKVLQQSSSRTLPDIQMLDAQDLPTIASSGALVDVTERGVPTDNIAENVLELGTFEDTVYGLAPTVGTVALFYNVDMLEEAGIEPPRTWADMKSAAQALTTSDRYGIAFSAKNDGQGSYAFLPLFWSAGATEDELDSTAAQKALQFEVDLVADGSASESVVQWGNSDVGDRFLSGEAAMALTSATQMSKLDEDKSLSYKIIETPVPEAGGTAVAPLGGEVWTLPHSGDDGREAAAAEVLECLASDDTQSSLAVDRRVIPANPELDASYVKELPGLQSYVDLVRNGRSRTALLGDSWPTANAAIWTAVQSAVTGYRTVEQSLDDAQQTVESARGTN